MGKVYFSFVVDALPKHYYEAELLLYSLQTNARISKDSIIIQCLNRVDEYFLNFLKENGYTYTLVEPYLDGKYCNKLKQLDFFVQHNYSIDAVVLLDTDMYIINPFEFEDGYVQAKVVDAPNPTLKTLKDIYNTAGVDLPQECDTDWDILNGKTFVNNFNGGLYYIPVKYVNCINRDWKKWAKWLYGKEELFEKRQQFIHIDQIAMGMAIAENRLPFKHLPANMNVPIHSKMKLRSLQNTKPIINLHYHRELNRFGYINYDKIENENLKNAIKKVNKEIYKYNSRFFEKFIEDKAKIKPVKTKELWLFEETIKEIVSGDVKLDLMFHAGTPKTGTTSLQFFLAKNTDMLQDNGIYYPNRYSKTPAPKHQWIVNYLKYKNFQKLAETLGEIYKQAIKKKDIHTILLSTEGIYNHWWDYPEESKQALKILDKYFNVSIIVFFRKSISFADSLYKQYLKNPKMKDIVPYGKDMTFPQMFEIKWFKEHLDYLGFVKQCEYLFTKDRVVVIQYSQDAINEFCNTVGIDYKKENIIKIDRKNRTYSDAVIEILKYVNRYDIKIEDKQEIVKILGKLDGILSRYSQKKSYADFIKEEINMLVAKQMDILKKNYGISFP